MSKAHPGFKAVQAKIRKTLWRSHGQCGGYPRGRYKKGKEEPRCSKGESSIETSEGLAMPWKIVKRDGPKPWKIIRADTGKIVGSSSTKAKALASMRIRYAAKEGKEK